MHLLVIRTNVFVKGEGNSFRATKQILAPLIGGELFLVEDQLQQVFSFYSLP